jgi:hypothetical protein
MHIGFSANFGKISGAQHRAKIQCPLAVAKSGEPVFAIFAYAPTTAYEHEHNLTPCPVRA